MTDSLWTQPEAAEYLRVSTGYLRRSSCPKRLLPSNRVGGKPLVRYDPREVRAWAEARQLKLQRAG
jgi:hypothetical protein